MRITRYRTVVLASVAVVLTFAVVRAQEPPGGRGAAGRGRGAAADQAPVPAARRGGPVVDMAAFDRGRALWASHCIDCHGTQARGTETGPNIIRTRTVNYDRWSPAPGSVLGPFLKAGHPTQSGKASASFTDDEVVALAQFVRKRVNDTMRGSEFFVAGDVLVGDAKAGEAYFNGAGGCATCHNASARNLAGIRSRIATTVDLQQRMLFPGPAGGRRGGPAPGAGAPPNPNAITVAVTPPSGQVISGVLIEQSDFYVTLRDRDGTLRVLPRAGARVVITNPLQAHVDLLDRISDTQIHDVVAYLETLK